MPGPMATCCWSREFDSTRKVFADSITEFVAITKADGVDLSDDYLAKQRRPIGPSRRQTKARAPCITK